MGDNSKGRWTMCRCKTYCTVYNSQTGRYEGSGVRISSATARRHLQEDARVDTLDDLSGNAAFRAIDDPILPTITPTGHTSYFHPDSTTPGFRSYPRTQSHEDLFTLESEVWDRISWTPADTRLVFAEKPGPWQEFVYPRYSEVDLSNHGPHVLDPTDRANTAYMENERRLCEILVQVRELDPMDDARERLEDKVLEGLCTMRQHKEKEWNRQRLSSIASYKGYAVVDSGKPFLCLPLSCTKFYAV